MSKWPMMPLGKVLHKSDDLITIDPHELYKEVTVRLWGKGVTLRREVAGAEIAAKTRLRVHAGQFIISRIDARNGASGIVPESLEEAIVSNDFPVFDADPLQLNPDYFKWFSKTSTFIDICRKASEGTTNRVRLKEDRFLAMEMPLPTIQEQERIASRIDALALKLNEARELRDDVRSQSRALLLSTYQSLIRDTPLRPMSEAAPLIRRSENITVDGQYHELGIRSFGRGTFHKPPVDGATIGNKRLYLICPGDLVFNNVFAWEGAVAVAQPEDVGRFGSHRFITCVPATGISKAEFLNFHFSTPAGLAQLGDASPGGAGRNRTLGLNSLADIQVPTPDYETQSWFCELLAKTTQRESIESTADQERDALLPAILNRAFAGEL